jgi:ATP-dependent DNA helicase RecQ
VTLCANHAGFAKETAEQFLSISYTGPDQLSGRESFDLVVAPQSSDSLEDSDIIVDTSMEGRMPVNPDETGMDIIGSESLALGVIRSRYQKLLKGWNSRAAPRPAHVSKQAIDYFARRILGVPFLYHHCDPQRPKTEERQYEIVKRVLEGKPVFGIMPTGRGKSVAFQLPAKILPGSALVISPLRALMRDQVEDLKCSRGYNTVDSISYDRSATERGQTIDEFLQGYCKLLYVSPERLQEMKFTAKLSAAGQTLHVSFLAIDEAHCVSEWGHDFRLSYMQIPRFISELRTLQGGTNCHVVALTATASPPVQRDITSILGLDSADIRSDGHIAAEANIDRTELSLSVHKVNGQSYPNDRRAAFQEVLSKVLDIALAHNHGFKWERFAKGDWRGKGSGVVFCLYKDARGQTAYFDGVGSIRDFLVASELMPASEVRIYAAEAPGYCPECKKSNRLNYTIRGMPKQQAIGNEDGDTFEDGDTKPKYQCSEGHIIEKLERQKDWVKYQPITQDGFKANKWPVLVTTKAYGMGIDHRGLRFVVHYGLSSSLESYYQEIGRAGRDGKHAHCALIARLPAPSCFTNYITNPDEGDIYSEKNDSKFLPPCLTSKHRRSRSCPPDVGLPEPCDLSRQLVMILETYIKPETFTKNCIKTWETLKRRPTTPQGERVITQCGFGPKRQKALQAVQNHLFRLQQLRVVERFTLEYKRHKGHFDVDFHVVLCREPRVKDVRDALLEKVLVIRASDGDRASAKRMKSLAQDLRYDIAQAVGWNDSATITKAPLAKAVDFLFRHIRGHVIRMRMESFTKLHTYLVSDEECRRKTLLGGMTSHIHGIDSHSCGFCDSAQCRPDMAFDLARAQSAPDSSQLHDIVDSGVASFQSQDFRALNRAVVEAQSRGVLAALGHRATSQIEHDPDNPAANLMAGIAHAASTDGNLRTFSHRYFKRFAAISNANSRDRDKAVLGYEWYQKVDPAEAIRSFAVSEGALDNAKDLSRLMNDAQGAPLSKEEKDNLRLACLAESQKSAIAKLKAVMPDLDSLL